MWRTQVFISDPHDTVVALWQTDLHYTQIDGLLSDLSRQVRAGSPLTLVSCLLFLLHWDNYDNYYITTFD